jgi:predicted nucleic acid-binding protein
VTFAYFDTSALVKRYVRERGSVQVVSLLRRHDVLTSAITPVEVFSALGRRKRRGELSEKNFSATLSRMKSDRVHWELVEAGEVVLNRAEEIVQGPVPMRSLDAIHLASSAAFQAAAAVRIPFVTADDRQREAGGRIGLDVIWVGT